MSQILNLQNIALRQIDFDSFSYALAPVQNLTPAGTLTESIARYGILHPPVVREIRAGLYSIVSGRKRLLALQSLQRNDTCDCLVIARQLPELAVFHVLLEIMRWGSKPTLVEKASFLQKIAVIADEKQIIDEFLPRLGLAPHAFSLRQARRVLELEDPILRSVHQGLINETVAHDLALLAPGDRNALFAIIETLQLSASYQKKLLHICRELAGRGKTNIAVLLGSAEVHAILHHPEANPPQKTRNLMQWLSSRHMPRSTQAAAEFHHFVAAMHLPHNVTVQHTPFFEDDAVTLAITFPDRKTMQQAWEKISHATSGTDN